MLLKLARNFLHCLPKLAALAAQSERMIVQQDSAWPVASMPLILDRKVVRLESLSPPVPLVLMRSGQWFSVVLQTLALGITWCVLPCSSRITLDENGITNAIEISQQGADTPRLITSNNDKLVRVFDSQSFQITR